MTGELTFNETSLNETDGSLCSPYTSKPQTLTPKMPHVLPNIHHFSSRTSTPPALLFALKSPHLLQRAERFGEVLQQLMCEDDIEGLILLSTG